MGDRLAQNGVGRQPDGLGEPGFFQPLIDRGDCVGGIVSEEPAAKVAVSIADDHRIEGVPPSIGAVDFAMPQVQRSSMPNWLNKKFGW